MLLRIYICVMDYINIVCVVSHLHIWDGLHKHSVLLRIYIFVMDYINIVCVVSHLHIWDGLH